MGKAVKIIIGLVVAAVAVVAVVGVLVLQNLDSIIKKVIEGVGSEVTGTEVRVSEVKFTLQEGRGEIYGLTIGNPPGYQSRHMFTMDEIAVQLEPASITGPVIVINEVLIDGAQLTAEQKGTTTNVQELLDSMQTGGEAPPAESSGEGADVRLMLEQFAFINSKGEIKSPQLGDKSLTIPDIRVSDIGDRETGLTPSQLASAMLSNVIKQVEKAVGNYLEKQVKDAAKAELDKQLNENLSEKDREKLDGLKNLIKKN